MKKKTPTGKNGQIEVTTDYELFVLKKGNRPVKQRVLGLIKAMEKDNQLEDYPILVSELKNGKLEIAEGQHRAAAAMALKLPIFFIRSKRQISIEQIASANQLQRSWNLSDWLHSWVEREHAEYMRLKQFCDDFRLPIRVALEVVGPSYGGSQTDKFKEGRWKIENMAFGKTVGHVLGALRGHVPTADLRLVRAIIRVLRVPGVSIERLIKKITTHASHFERQSNWTRYVELLEKLYNKNTRVEERLAIAFKVDQMEWRNGGAPRNLVAEINRLAGRREKRQRKRSDKCNKSKKEKDEEQGELSV